MSEEEMLDFCHGCPDYDVCVIDPEEITQMTEWDKLQEGLPRYQVQGVFSGVPESDRDYTRRLKEYIKKLWTEGDKMQTKLTTRTLELESVIEKNWAKREKLEVIKATRNILYDSLPTGRDIDAFELIKAIKAHILKLDEILECQSIESTETPNKKVRK